jgi:hypothetical protein
MAMTQHTPLDEKAVAALDAYMDGAMGDGLPVIPPTDGSMAAMVAGMGGPPGTVIGIMPPGQGEARVEHLAANAILAGCRPEHGPVVLAAVRAMLDEAFTLAGVACSTKGCAPLVIVNGPIRHALGMNAKGNVLGHGNRANATIGRAVRLIVQNVGQALPDVLDRATLGHPGKYSYCIAEDEEGSPWEPLHVERGLDPSDSAVTVFGGEAPRLVNVHKGTAEAVLFAIADTMATVGILNEDNITGRCPHLVVLATEHRDMLAADGWTKSAIKAFIREHAVISREALERMGASSPEATPVLTADDDVLLVAAGGDAGRFACVIPGWSGMSQPVTREIEPAQEEEQ